MTKYAQLVTAVALLTLPFSNLAWQPAFAETVGIERALVLLAKTTVVDDKCHILTVSERDELSNYISRAEVSAAEKTTVEITRSSLAAGKQAGKRTACDEQARADVKDTLMAAREAIKTVTQKEQVAAAKPPAKLASLEKLPAVAVAAVPVTTGNLSSYARITEAYFLERRCTYLSKREITSFYNAVLKNHAAAIAQFGKPAVSAARKHAEGRANAKSCNDAGQALIQASFAEVASR